MNEYLLCYHTQLQKTALGNNFTRFFLGFNRPLLACIMFTDLEFRLKTSLQGFESTPLNRHELSYWSHSIFVNTLIRHTPVSNSSVDGIWEKWYQVGGALRN